MLTRMAMRVVDIDDELLEQARHITGAATIKDTVNTALKHVVAAELRQRHALRLAGLRGTDIADDDVMSGAWR